MIMPRYPWRSSHQTGSRQHRDTRSTRNPTWLHRLLNLNPTSPPEAEINKEARDDTSQEGTHAPSSHPTNTTSSPATSPLLNLPPELRQKILKYTITDADIQNHLLYESVQTSPSTWEARVYYFDGREFAWDDEASMFSRAPFQESQALSMTHPLLTADMRYVKKEWVKRVRAIGEEKRKEVLRELLGERGADPEGGAISNHVYRGFGESSRITTKV
ncbi:hypothetical protein FKW77_004072 [Venturia effusa]|uniref:Uncharacterized protein n=1 Tax=Venturia effusa TaxID=50376 RepID=A0A517LAT8_9PEZI|nr:hypothetical protein FKW77_004072 [Venturia effusa]